jgi:hypothetical protein
VDFIFNELNEFEDNKVGGISPRVVRLCVAKNAKILRIKTQSHKGL